MSPASSRSNGIASRGTPEASPKRSMESQRRGSPNSNTTPTKKPRLEHTRVSHSPASSVSPTNNLRRLHIPSQSKSPTEQHAASTPPRDIVAELDTESERPETATAGQGAASTSTATAGQGATSTSTATAEPAEPAEPGATSTSTGNRRSRPSAEERANERAARRSQPDEHDGEYVQTVSSDMLLSLMNEAEELNDYQPRRTISNMSVTGNSAEFSDLEKEVVIGYASHFPRKARKDRVIWEVFAERLLCFRKAKNYLKWYKRHGEDYPEKPCDTEKFKELFCNIYLLYTEMPFHKGLWRHVHGQVNGPEGQMWVGMDEEEVRNVAFGQLPMPEFVKDYMISKVPAYMSPPQSAAPSPVRHSHPAEPFDEQRFDDGHCDGSDDDSLDDANSMAIMRADLENE